MERKVRIFLVCALGTMAGLAVAWFVPEIVWWVGALIGGAVSGFLYALPEIKRYAAPAARLAWRTLRYVPRICQGIASLRKVSALTKWKVAAVLMLAALMIIILAANIIVTNINPALTWLIFPSLFYLGFAEIHLLVAAMNSGKDLRKVQKAVLFASPVGPLFVTGLIIIGAVKLIPTAVKIAPELGQFLVRFVKILYIYIHSRELVLCTVDGTLGVLVSYILCVKVLNLPLGSTLLVGGLIGGLLGILNYEIISKRVLHLDLVPNK